MIDIHIEEDLETNSFVRKSSAECVNPSYKVNIDNATAERLLMLTKIVDDALLEIKLTIGELPND